MVWLTFLFSFVLSYFYCVSEITYLERTRHTRKASKLYMVSWKCLTTGICLMLALLITLAASSWLLHGEGQVYVCVCARVCVRACVCVKSLAKP